MRLWTAATISSVHTTIDGLAAESSVSRCPCTAFCVDHFVFALKDASSTPNLPVSSCVMTRFVDANGKDVIRPYTPINQHEKGVLNLLIKVYPQGVMSRHIHSLKVGDSLEIKGPFPKVRPEPLTLAQPVIRSDCLSSSSHASCSHSRFAFNDGSRSLLLQLKYEANKWKQIGMVAGGTGE
jgi:hypothetical protein